MRVLHLISSVGMYGAEAVILNLSRELRSEGHESLIASFSNASRQLHDRAIAGGFESMLLPCNGQFDVGSIRHLRKALSVFRPDVVHCHGYKPDIYALLGACGTSVPLVSTCHTWYDTDPIVKLYGIIDRLVLRAFDQVVAVSVEVERQLLRSGVRPERIRRIRNGIDTKTFERVAISRNAAVAKSGLRVGLVGRLAQEKGIDIFIEAASLLATSHPELNFVVFGEGAERPILQELIDRRGLRDRLVLAGQREDICSAFAELDILVSSSRQEGLPIALLEGMASELPVVGTAVGEVPTAISHGETGLLVPSGDVAALAAGIAEIAEDEVKRKLFARRARRRMEEFSLRQMFEEYLATYQSAIAQAASR